MSLQEEIDRKASEIHSDAYTMSIGELINLYRDGELDIHPEFQRFYRWSSSQKARFVESILLGIPIPSIFVAQRPDGVWDVVDGTQRLSTIFHLVGVLKNEAKEQLAPLVLEGTKYLPSLAGKTWDDPSDMENSFTPEQRLFVKRSKLDLKIILRQSSETSKYELFQRINTGGTQLTAQELRNCILVMLNKPFFEWLLSLARDPDFQEAIALSDKAIEEQYDVELALRFLVFRTLPEEQMRNFGDINDFLTDKMVELAETNVVDYERESEAFKSTFRLINAVSSANAFRRVDEKSNRPAGGFSISIFEIIALGIGFNYDHLDEAKVQDRLHKLWTEPRLYPGSSSGVRAELRVPKTVPLGRYIFGS